MCFRHAPAWFPAERLDELNAGLGAARPEDERIYVGTTRYAGRTALRPALVNWRTREEDVDLFIAVVREVGAAVAKCMTLPAR